MRRDLLLVADPGGPYFLSSKGGVAFFVQDDWKVKIGLDRLTSVLRYDLFFQPAD